MKNTLYLVILLTLLTLSQPLSADVILTVEVDPPVNGGDVASVSVFATSTNMQLVTGFNLPIDIGPTGTGLPPELSFLPNNESIVNEIAGVPGGLNTTSIINLNNTDAIVNVTGFEPVALSDTPTLLFDLLLNVSPDALPGSFPVTINNGDAVGNGFSFNISDGDGDEILASVTSVSSGSVNIVSAVPEPSSAVLAISALAGLALRRRR